MFGGVVRPGGGVRPGRGRAVALLLAMTAVAIACSSAPDDSAETASTADAETTDAPAETTTTQAPTEEPVDESAELPTVRSITTDFGTFEIPAEPERILVLDPVIALPTALDLGAPVVGTLSSTGDAAINALITDEEWAGLEILGSSTQASLEAVAAAEPDLILISPTSEEEFELYAQIAPAVPLVLTNRWQDDAALVAEALGSTAEFEQQLADYQARADEIGEAIDEGDGDPAIAVVRIRPDQIRVHTSVHFAGNVLDDVGVRIPEDWIREPLEDPVANLRQRIQPISLEQLGLLDTADHLLVLVEGTPAQSDADVTAAFDEVTGSALWAGLPAVQAGNVHIVERHWLAGSLRAARLSIEDLATIFEVDA
ncbi:MAG: ABC transporter substrate-binding protein [Actinomycetota bacterium]